MAVRLALRLTCLLVLTASHVAAAQSVFPADSTIQSLVQSRVDWGVTPGIIVGTIDASGKRRYYAAGRRSGAGSIPVDSVTLFELGSVTKVFTATLLAEMANRGEVGLDHPLNEYLRAPAKLPSRGGAFISLAHLATHTSGLPRMPTNFQPVDRARPYADYGEDKLYAFLESYDLRRDPGATYEYSNLGFGLLGHVLALKCGSSYERCLIERVLGPLQMGDTKVTLNTAQRTRAAVGHTIEGDSTPEYRFAVLEGAGALQSNARDLLLFLRSAIGPDTSDAGRALAGATPARVKIGPQDSIGLGWQTSATATSRRRLVWHNGENAGFHAFIGFDPDLRVGVVVLANAAVSIDAIGFHILDQTRAVRREPPWPPVVQLSAASLAGMVGTYEFSATERMQLLLESGQLYAQVAGQDRYKVYPSSDSTFFWKIVPSTAVVRRDSTGLVTALVVRQGGRESIAKRRP